MGFLDMLRNLIKSDELDHEELMQERDKIKNEIFEILRKKRNFTELECREVMVYIDESERKIEALKREMDIATQRLDDPTAKIKELRQEIEEETQRMNQKIVEKADEISLRKETRS